MTHSKREISKVLAVFYIALSLMSCQNQKKENEKLEEVIIDQKEDKEVHAPEQIVTIEQAKTMYDNYSKRRVGLIEKYETSVKPKEEFHVARLIEYDYETIKNYLAFIEQEAKKADVEISSLRFYFSNYADEQTFKDGEKVKHPRQNSLFMLPTTTLNGKEVGFLITEDEKGKIKAISIQEGLGLKPGSMGAIHEMRTKQEAGFFSNFSKTKTIFYSEQSLIMNRGGAKPPPENTSDF
ncbi:MAG: hypothetical protein V3U92_02960 [Cellulophaga sp.]